METMHPLAKHITTVPVLIANKSRSQCTMWIPEDTEDQSVTSPSGEALGSNVHVRHSERIRKSPQRYEPGLGAAREWKYDVFSSIVHIIRDGYLNSNIDTNDILSLLDEWYAEDCMYIP